MERKLILRHKVLTFMKPQNTTATRTETANQEDKFYLLYGFTELNESANPQEYSRKYINEPRERTDVIGMTKVNSFNFDYYEGDPVHADIKNIYDQELTGSETEREFVVVEMYKDIEFTINTENTESKTGEKKQGKKAFSRKSTIIISDRAGEEAITYSGSINVSSDKVDGVVISEDNWETCKFYEMSKITESQATTLNK